MKFGVCNLSIVPCRKEPSDKSELVTQLLFGETLEILDEKDAWLLVKLSYDDYECWIDSKQILQIDENTFNKINSSKTHLTSDAVALMHNYEGAMFPVVIGSALPLYSNKICLLGEKKFLYEGNSIDNFNPSPEKVIDTAKKFLNSPYLWGGKTIFGCDCSGFTQTVFKLNGLKLLRDAYQQAEQGNTVDFADEAKPGDLAFFDNKEGKIVHVGIIYESGKIIHASGKVRIDKFDHQGIYNAESSIYSHKLRVIKRFIF